MSEINDEKKKKIIEADALSVDDALEIAQGEGGARKKNKETFFADVGTREVPKEYRIIPEQDNPAKVYKANYYDSPEKNKSSKSSSELYADVTERIIKEAALAKEQDKQQKKEIKEKLKNVKTKANKKAVSSTLQQAHGDYELEGEVNAVIANNEMYLRRMEHNKKKRKLIALVLLIMLLLFLLTFGISTIVNSITGFTVNLNGGDHQKGLTLYDNAAFENGTSRLETTSIPECDNTTYSEIIDLVQNTIDKKDGQQSKQFLFFAYSFYVSNIGRGEVDFKFRVNMSGYSKGVDDSVRVLIVDDSINYLDINNKRQINVYAKPKCDPKNGKWLYDENNNPIMQQLYDPSGALFEDRKQDKAKSFVNSSTAVEKEVKKFSFKEGKNILKYTVVIYLEGGDEDCVSAIKGGGIKFNIDLLVTDYRLDIDA